MTQLAGGPALGAAVGDRAPGPRADEDPAGHATARPLAGAPRPRRPLMAGARRRARRCRRCSSVCSRCISVRASVRTSASSRCTAASSRCAWISAAWSVLAIPCARWTSAGYSLNYLIIL